MKLALFVLAIVLLAWMIFGRKRLPRDPAGPKTPRPPDAKPRELAVMQACAHCGVLLPEAEALRDAAGQAYCSDAHRRAGPREPS